MLTQRALHIELSEGRLDRVEVESPHFVGPVEYAWNSRNDNDPTIFGVGPLVGTSVPGASGLVMAGRSPLWDGFYTSILSGAGLILQALECDLLSLRGKAPQPSILVVSREKERHHVRVEPLDPEPLWQGTHDGDGVFALLHSIAARQGAELANATILGVGPAAARTRFGGLCSVQVKEGRPTGTWMWIRRGGLGSRLYQVHHLCAVVIASTGTAEEQRSEHDGVLDSFHRGMSVQELEEGVRFEFGPKLKSWGTLGATFDALRQRTLWFNSSSVHCTEEERDDLYRRALREHFLVPFHSAMREEEGHRTCGEACPLRCQKTMGGRIKDFEVYATLGPQLGVADHAAADRVVKTCETLGFDVLALGGVLGWLMERLLLGQEEPWRLGLGARPRWSASDFDPVADSQHNARMAQDLTHGLLFSDWGKACSRGLRQAAQKTGGASASLAVYNANGEIGEMAPYPYWSPGFYAPMPISGEFFEYHGLEFMPPRVLGRKSAQRMVAELMLQNLGVCRLHHGWAESLLPDLINRRFDTTTDWSAHHRNLARRIYRRRKARFWETERVVDIVARFLQNYQHSGAPDGELDRWVSRFREDKASAARAFWSEINVGLEEIFGA